MSHYVAQPYVAGTPQAEVIGHSVLAFTENLQSEVVIPILPKYGLGNIDPDAWYPHQAWLNVLEEVSHSAGNAMSTFVAFGKSVVENAVMPPEINSIPAALHSLHAIHHLNLRNVPEEEGYEIQEVDSNHYIVYENTPNPSDAIYGFLWAMCKRFKNDGEIFTVKVIENPDPKNHPGTCFDITWG